jgi:trehalose/maltose hydrolase-like predicted phosphorylase
VILQDRFTVGPWNLREPHLDLDLVAQTESVFALANGKLIRLFVEDEPFDVRYGELRSHERLLDFRAGCSGATPSRCRPTADGPGLLGPAGLVRPAGGRGARRC